MEYDMIENLDKLPPLLQFIIIMAWIIIPSGIGYLGRKDAARNRERLEDVERQRKLEDAQHKERVTVIEQTHTREMQEMRNEFEQLRVAHEQNKSLTDIVHTTITSSNSVVKSVNDLVSAMNDTRIESISFRTDMKGIIETLGLQIGKVDNTSKRTEQIVTEKTTLTLQSVEALVRNNEMIKAAVETLTKRIEEMSEVQDGHIEAANTRHVENRQEMKNGFQSIVDALHTVQRVLETNNAMLQQSKPALPTVTTGHTETDETENKKSA